MDIINKINQDIEDIEYIINHEREINLHNKMIRNIKITKNIFKLSLPYILTPVISFFVMSHFGHSPIINEPVKEKEKILKSIDSLGNIREISQYEEIRDVYNVIYYYHQWELQETNEYQRTINKYYINYSKLLKEIKNKSDTEIINMLNDVNLLEKEFIINSNQIMLETRNNITNDELNEAEFFKIIIYDEDENKFIIRNQKMIENIGDIIGYIVLTIIIEIINKVLLKNKTKKIIAENKRIIKEYIPLDKKIYQKKLIIRKNNLKRLTE